MTSATVDPITLELLQETLISVVREMRANLVATAYSSIIYEAHDFSCVLVDDAGQIVAQAEDNPSHIFPVPWSVREMFRKFPGDIHPGDVFLHNDPYNRRHPFERHRHDLSGVRRWHAGAVPGGPRPLGRRRRHHTGQHLRQIDRDLPRRRAYSDPQGRQQGRARSRCPGPVVQQHACPARAAR